MRASLTHAQKNIRAVVCRAGELDVFPVELFLDVPDASDGLTDFQSARYTVSASSTCRVLCIPRKTLLRSFRAYPADRDLFRRAAMDYTQVPSALYRLHLTASHSRDTDHLITQPLLSTVSILCQHRHRCWAKQAVSISATKGMRRAAPGQSSRHTIHLWSSRPTPAQMTCKSSCLLHLCLLPAQISICIINPY